MESFCNPYELGIHNILLLFLFIDNFLFLAFNLLTLANVRIRILMPLRLIKIKIEGNTVKIIELILNISSCG
jgi:hypothetical protein